MKALLLTALISMSTITQGIGQEVVPRIHEYKTATLKCEGEEDLAYSDRYIVVLGNDSYGNDKAMVTRSEDGATKEYSMDGDWEVAEEVDSQLTFLTRRGVDIYTKENVIFFINLKGGLFVVSYPVRKCQYFYTKM